MHDVSHYWHISRRLYGTRRWTQKKRGLVFFVHCMVHRQNIEDLYTFFDNYEPMPEFFQVNEDFLDVMTRVFLYKNSTMASRYAAIIHHFTILQSFFSDDTIRDLYLGQGITLWKSDDPELPLEASLAFLIGQRKEGFLTLKLSYKSELVYQFNFRFDYNRQGQTSLYVGTIQGTPHGLANTKILTKKLFGYRPKNFILYLLRIFTQTLGISNLYVISDDGFYTNSHIIRGNRSKKTVFNDFWLEEGAVETSDEANYFLMPVEEKRRKYDEIKSQKRNLFRKRYLLMDHIIPSYVQVLYALLRPGFMPVPTVIDEALLEKPEGYDPIQAPPANP